MDNKKKGIICIIIAAFSFATMSLFIRLSGPLPLMEKSFFRNAVALLIASAVLIKTRTPLDIPKGAGKYLLGRALAGTVGLIGNFYAVDHLILSDASMLAKLAPFFVILFSYLILKEKVNKTQILCLIVAFAGSILVIKPGFGSENLLAALAGFVGAIGAGMAYAFVRVLSTYKVNKNIIVLVYCIVTCLIAVPFAGTFIRPTGAQFLALLGIGITAACGQFAVTAAYTYAPGREISVYDYSQVIFAAIWGFIFFDQVADILSYIGYGIICLAAILNTVYGNKKN